MKYKLAVCKINMIGASALVLGFCRYDDDDSFWQKFQLFTMEEYLDGQFTFPEWLSLQKAAQKLSKYHGDTIHFTSIGKDVEIFKQTHDFDFDQAEVLEITKEEWKVLGKELASDGWTNFDIETWGK